MGDSLLGLKQFKKYQDTEEEISKLKETSGLGGASPAVLKLQESKKGLKLALESGKKSAAMQSAKALKSASDATDVVKAGDLSKATKAAKLSGGTATAATGVDLLGKAGVIDTSSEVGGGLSGAAEGAAAGAPLAAATGGMSVLIGAAIGGVSGAIGAGEARKKKLAKIEAEKQKALGDIAERKAERLQSAFSNLGANLSGLF